MKRMTKVGPSKFAMVEDLAPDVREEVDTVESIENKTLREMIADRDRALAAKEKEIHDLGNEIRLLFGNLEAARSKAKS